MSFGLYRDFTNHIYGGFSYVAPVDDSVPNGIANQLLSNVLLGRWIEFTPVQVSGINVEIIASITGGEMAVSVDGEVYGAFSSSDQSVSDGFWIHVRVFSSDINNDQRSAQLDLAGITASFTAQTVAVFTASKEVLKVSRTNDLIFLHDGKTIPVTSAKSPLSRIYKGFSLLGMEEDESIISHSILINDQLVVPGDVIDGMTFHGSQTDGLRQVKAEISGGIVGKTYRLTLNYSTQYVPSDYRSQEFEVKYL